MALPCVWLFSLYFTNSFIFLLHCFDYHISIARSFVDFYFLRAIVFILFFCLYILVWFGFAVVVFSPFFFGFQHSSHMNSYKIIFDVNNLLFLFLFFLIFVMLSKVYIVTTFNSWWSHTSLIIETYWTGKFQKWYLYQLKSYDWLHTLNSN